VYRHRLGHLFNEKRDVIRFFSATFFIVLLDVAFILLEVFQRLLLSL
jgi:hypothetical protein|tara:strand:+ start:220 stop:360 length:141 start_codon:yes stop_codon:yes gene_type:complete